MKQKRILCGILSMILTMSLFLTGPPIEAQAASYTTVVSSQTDKYGLIDYGNVTADYIILNNRMQLIKTDADSITQGHVNQPNATVVFEKKDANGNWVTDTNPPFSFSRTTMPYNSGSNNGGRIQYRKSGGGEWGENGKTFTNNRIRITFPNAALKYDGTYHDVNMTISNVFLRSSKGDTIDKYAILTASATGGIINLSSYSPSTLNDDGTWNTDHSGGTMYDVKVSVSGGKSTDKLFMAFTDLDLPGFSRYEGSFAEKSCIESLRINSGIFPNTQPHVASDHSMRIVNGEKPEYYPTGELGNTGGTDIYRTGVSWMATASGTSFRWMGHSCGTGIGMTQTSFPSFTVDTKVRAETAGSPVSGTTIYGDYTQVHSQWFISLMSASYSHSYTKNAFYTDWSLTAPTDDWIFDYSGKTVSGTGIREDKTFYIDINRNRYTYSFKPNPPSDRTAANISNMPGDKTVVASTSASGKSDAAVKIPALSGYVFKGWNTKTDGSGSAYPGTETMKSDKVFYAQWERATYKVHFDANGSHNPDHETGEFTQNATTGTMADQVMQFDVSANLNANQFGRAGYTFAGWNTKADGSGTSYADQQSVKNLIGYDKSEITLYAQWVKKLGTETITVVSEETGNPVGNVHMKLQKNVNGNWTDIKTGKTDVNGQIYAENLHWFDYRWVMEGVPAGYVKSADTTFHINWDALSAENQVILYLKHVQIVLDSQVSDIIKGEQPPAFLYHISGTDAAGVAHEYHLLVQTDAVSRFGTSRITDLFAGTYTVTQTAVSRYIPGTAVNVEHSTPKGIYANVDVLNHDSAEVKFPYTIREYGWHYGVNSAANHLVK